MPYYVCVDTNVLVSSMLSKYEDSATVILIKRLILGDIIPIYSNEILKEYKDVLHRKKFNFSTDKINYIIAAITQFGLLIEPSPSGEILPDIKDIPFYDVVMEKRQTNESYLVTGNIKHFPTKTFIVTPKEMLDIMDLNS